MTKTLFETNNETFKTLREDLELRFGRFILRKGVNKPYLIEQLRKWAEYNKVSDKDLRIMVHFVDNNFTWGDENKVTPCNSKTAIEVILDDIENDRDVLYGIVPGKGLVRGYIPARHAGFDFGMKNEMKVLSYKRKSSRINYIKKTLDRLGVDLSILQ
jgi:hypothetical protein